MSQRQRVPDPARCDALDAWESRWFPIASASLRFRFPTAHAWLFDNLRRTDGLDVVLSVGTLARRLKQLSGSGVEGAEEARAVLVERGLTEAVLDEARDLLLQICPVDPGLGEPSAGPQREEGP